MKIERDLEWIFGLGKELEGHKIAMLYLNIISDIGFFNRLNWFIIV